VNALLKGISFPVRYLALSLAWLTLAIYAGTRVWQLSLWSVLLLVVVFALPLFSAGAYGATVRRIHRAAMFSAQGVVFSVLTSRIFAYLGWLLWSLGSALLLLFYLGTVSPLEWLLVLASLPVFTAIYALNRRVVVREVKPYIATHMALLASRWLLATTMAGMTVLAWVLGNTSAEPLAVGDAIARVAAETPLDSSSVLLGEVAHGLVQYQGIKLFALSNLHAVNGVLYLLFVALGSFALYFNIGLALSAFVVPSGEYRRVLAPVVDADNPPAVSARSAGVAAALGVIFLGFIYIPSAAYLEYWLQSHPDAVGEARNSGRRVVETLEMIESEYYLPGTIEQVRQAQAALMRRLDLELDTLAAHSDQGFQLMTDNVDGYLDWYYSLIAEYLRIGAMLTGSLEQLMTEQLREHLMRGDAFADLQQSLDSVTQRQRELQLKYRAEIEQILDNNRVLPTSKRLSISSYLPLEAVMSPPEHSSFTGLESRMLISGTAASAITALIATKVIAKVVGKGTLKLGAKALAKVAASKASSTLGGSAAGAAAGAAVGSVVPGLGTVAGAVIGGIAGGLAVGVTVEVLLLMLEEAISRDDFRQQIVAAIEEARLDYRATLYAESPRQ
jgi:hypothetical protein